MKLWWPPAPHRLVEGPPGRSSLGGMERGGPPQERVATGRPGSHRCPRCGARHAERRTPRTLRERTTLALLGRFPYGCLQCGRRFHDRPGDQRSASAWPLYALVVLASFLLVLLALLAHAR
jgi:hypothetical protein